ncbi:16S rRNA (guanine(527)-N(7))-methyltransferase RsmG [Calditerricola satsumensis]|uniref:Ribosomal RNA small subunit methyltransferase G n=1 Tax=Calditerricola satsumensis TaxID=373054 RepID=A0A8J3BCN5_9BACI|nr:16S rRNA (guanine(527)-N(7))-methyltransferase RsmG [Calditerricola satsumensis]GGJ97290.1 ribosomal RNA small subunit methyltransferase G [Calditerricola satsumensis]
MAFDLTQALAERGWALTAAQREAFDRYYRLLVAWNERVNLTAITDPEGVALKHFYDSLTPAFYTDFSGISSLVDIGSGAGFPGLPLKLRFPHLALTIVDSLKKRIAFLEEAVRELGLSGVTLIHGRAEAVGRDPAHRERYDVAIARAVARLNVLGELCLPFVRVGGLFIAMKGSDVDDEVREAQGAIATLGGSLERIERFALPANGGGRTLLFIAKRSPTPAAYPRKPGMPEKKPLR